MIAPIKTHLLLPVCILAVFSTRPLSGAPPQTVNLPAEADTGLHETAPNNNMGGHTHAPSGTTNQGARTRALFRFNLEGALPDGAMIESVILHLSVTGVPSGGGAPSSFSLYRALQPWGEGTKTSNTGRGATSGEATWRTHSFPDGLWSEPGGSAGTDYLETASATTPVGGISTYAFGSTELLIQDVEQWISDPSSNHGWFLLSESEGVNQTARRFGTREASSNAPELEITYSMTSTVTPEAPVIENPQRNGENFQFSFVAQELVSYEIQSTGSLLSDWSTLTNVPPLSMGVTVEINDTMTDGPAFYRVLATPVAVP